MLHRWTIHRLREENPEVAKTINAPLHQGQIPIVNAIFRDAKLEVMAQCGRSFGKTEVVLYIAVRWALTFPKSKIYILCPQRKQGKEIYWSSRRLQDYAHSTFIEEERDSELRLCFKNGSFICIDGSDNYASLRGIKPNLVVYDEFQDHDPRVDVAMRPNLGSKRAPLIRIGTPPDKLCYYTDVRANIVKRSLAGSARHFYLERPTSTNPFYDKIFLAEERDRLIAAGDEDEYLREYEGKFIPGGKKAVFPMFFRRKPQVVRPRAELLKMIERDMRSMQWYTVIDPGQSCCALLFAAVNKHSNQIYILDEIYEKNRSKTSTGEIWPLMRQQQQQLYPSIENWRVVVDEAASWFRVEAHNRYNETDEAGAAMHATKKSTRNKKDDISIIKDMLLSDGAIYIAKEAKNMISEMENYITKDDGTYYDKDDHQIDNLRYLLSDCGFALKANEEIDSNHYEKRVEGVDFNSLIRQHQFGVDPFNNMQETTEEEYVNERDRFYREREFNPFEPYFN